MDGSVAADPTTVLTAITTGLGNLQVSSVPTSSEPSTPLGAGGNESPLTLDAGLREWLTETLVANSTSNPKVYVKLLVSNAASGSIIGKAGGNINDVQAKTYARIQLSKANEYFPGTTERTLLVTGRLKQVVAALGLIFAKLLREGVAPLSPKSKAAAAFTPTSGSEGEEAAEPPPLRLLVRLLVPQPLCGVIIGKNGVTIRNYAADTGTVIRVTSSEASQAPSSHRIVTIAGDTGGVLKAIALMTLKQSDDPKFPLYGELPSPSMSRGGFAAPVTALPPQFLPHPGGPYVPGPPGMFGGGGGGAPAGMFPLLPPGMGGAVPAAVGGGDNFTSLTLVLTEDQAGLLLDQGTRTVVEVEQMTGCRVRLDMADGPRGPFGRLALAGAPESVAYAQWLLGQRLAAAAASFQISGTTYYAHGPSFAPAPMATMGFWQPAGMMAPQQHGGGAAGMSQAQQQHLMAAAAAGMMQQAGMMPQHHLAMRQHSGSLASTP